jgi:hypothetical protein
MIDYKLQEHGITDLPMGKYIGILQLLYSILKLAKICNFFSMFFIQHSLYLNTKQQKVSTQQSQDFYVTNNCNLPAVCAEAQVHGQILQTNCFETLIERLDNNSKYSFSNRRIFKSGSSFTNISDILNCTL